MKSDKEVNEQVDEDNQTQEGRAKKGTSNAKNNTSRCIGLGLHKIFAALPEEEKGTLRAICFAPLLLIDQIATMSTLVVKIFNHHLGDMKFQFGETIIQMKPIHVCLILGLRISPIANEFLFVDPEHMTNFRMRRIPNKKNTYGRCSSIKFVKNRTIISPPEKGVKHLGERYQIEAFVIGVAPAIGSSSSTTEIEAVVVRYQFSTPDKTAKHKREGGNEKKIGKGIRRSQKQNKQVVSREGLEVVNNLMVDDDVEVKREVNFKAISSEYGGDLLESKKDDEKENDEKKDVEVKVTSEEEQPQTMVVAEVVKTDIVFFNQEEVVGEAYQASVDQTTVVSVVEQTLEVKKTEDEASRASIDQTTVVSVEEKIIEVAQTEEVISHQEEDVGEASQSKEEVEQNKEEVVEGKDDNDGNSQNKPDPEQDKKNQVDQVWPLRKDELSPEAKKDNRSTYMRIGEETVCLNAIYTLYPNQWLDSEVIDVYIKILIQYFDTKHRARPDIEKIVLADIFACQYIGRDFNVWTLNMSSPEVVYSKSILILWNINDSHWVFCVMSFKARKICIYDSMVDSKIVNTRKKKKLSPEHQLIEDQISTIVPKMLIWRDFADHSSPPTGSDVNDYGLNSKWTTHFGKCPIQPNGNDCRVYMLVFMDNLLREMKFPDLIDGNECRYTIAYDILKLEVEPDEILKL
ncbi:hypothetical protein GIB67_031805 [Kingdonia uniflora]|uniref:Ubiquitin-like protease family profile domain-containing protein n=1 Tax=Kingdonia uniflora TaxID=39325 RepID=A0A7J7L4H3_9MAGN|nr:hypothetical protein GIB67_031805 [Kingdonia uniflora]